jgi:hypothetical protein
MSGAATLNAVKMISPEQRSAIFAAARRLCMEINDVRAMTPAGSVSQLTYAQASDILDSLNRGSGYQHPRTYKRPARRPKGVYRMVTPDQLSKIESLRIELGWEPDRLQAWLAKRRHNDGRPMTRVDSSADGVAVIELLKGVQIRQAKVNVERWLKGESPVGQQGGRESDTDESISPGGRVGIKPASDRART